MPTSPLNLRVAFFGSDLFSLVSLQRLAQLKPLVSHIDVFTRSCKPVGRKKTITDVPVGDYALKLNLSLFRVDSAKEILRFRQKQYDLAIAVSFGLFIPGLFIDSLRYGGVNVHPSLLPKFSGSSPIQYAIMNDCKSTGVTVQTLHPTKFDRGNIIRQSKDVDIGSREKFDSLRDRLAVVGAGLLESVLAGGDIANPTFVKSSEIYSLAPKILTGLSAVSWDYLTCRQMCRLEDALGPLHTWIKVDDAKKKKHKAYPQRVILKDIVECEEQLDLSSPGDFCVKEERLVVKAIDSCISVGSIKREYCDYELPSSFVALLELGTSSTPKRFINKPFP